MFVSRETRWSLLFSDEITLLHTELAFRTKNVLCSMQTMWPSKRLHNDRPTRLWKKSCAIDSSISPHWHNLMELPGALAKASYWPRKRFESPARWAMHCLHCGTLSRGPMTTIIELSPSSSIKLSLTAPTSLTFNIMPNPIIAECQTEQPSTERKPFKHTDIRNRSSGFWAISKYLEQTFQG